MSLVFEWDVYKELDNIFKHKVVFREAIEVFADPNVIHLEDEKHSSDEDRFSKTQYLCAGKFPFEEVTMTQFLIEELMEEIA